MSLKMHAIIIRAAKISVYSPDYALFPLPEKPVLSKLSCKRYFPCFKLFFTQIKTGEIPRSFLECRNLQVFFIIEITVWIFVIWSRRKLTEN